MATFGIIDPAGIAGSAGLGQQWSMLFEICLLCATAPVCMFWFWFVQIIFICFEVSFLHFSLSLFELYQSFVSFFRSFVFFFFYILLFLFEEINWCFVSYSFVSVKGPGRKLSLPTDLKTDLGTVGESQQFTTDLFLSHLVSAFVSFSRLLCCFSSFYSHTLSSFSFFVNLYSCLTSP